MKNTIAVFAIITVATVSIGVTGIATSTLMTASTPIFTASSGMMGHLEYTLLDSDGFIKAYGQTDNIITNSGDRCISELVFETNSADNTPGAACANANFDVIAISNATVTIDDALDVTDDTVASSDTGVLATVKAAVDVGSGGSGGNVVTITNSAHPFTFTDNVNATNTLTGAYLVDAECALDDVTLGTLCDGALFAGEILAGQTLSSLAISDGDSLTITWTVTVGAANT